MSERRMAAWMLRRLAPRALRVLARHQAAEPVLATFAETLPSAVERYRALDSDGHALPLVRPEVERRSATTRELHERMHAWLVLLERDVPHFVRPAYAANVAEDVAAAGRELVDTVALHSSLRYAEPLSREITALAERLEGETAAVEVAVSQGETMGLALREAASVLEQQLVSFRRAVRRVVGRSHRDYRRLLIRSNSLTDDTHVDDDAADVTSAGEVSAPVQAPVAPTSANGVGRREQT